MHAISPLQGFRFFPKTLDMLMLQDLGYTVHLYEAPVSTDHVFREHSLRRAYFQQRPRAGKHPVGLWDFRNFADRNSAIIGVPMKFMPARNNSAGAGLQALRGGGVRVAKDAHLLIDHGLTGSSAGGGKEINAYSLVLDIRLPKTGREYSLYNTSPTNGNTADAYINPKGALGQGDYSKTKLRAGVWYRVVLAVDIKNNRREYFLNGKRVLSLAAGELDGRFAFYSTETSTRPFLVLFGSSKIDEDNSIDLRRAALYDFALSEAQVSRLGGPE